MTSVADTRLLITFKFPSSEEVKHKIVRLIGHELPRKLLLPSIVITEYINIAGRRVGVETSLIHISELENRGTIIIKIDKEIAVEAGKLLIKHPEVPTADAIIAATAAIAKAEYVISNDPHFTKLETKTKWI